MRYARTARSPDRYLGNKWCDTVLGHEAALRQQEGGALRRKGGALGLPMPHRAHIVLEHSQGEGRWKGEEGRERQKRAMGLVGRAAVR